jgi:hypothetical protein
MHRRLPGDRVPCADAVNRKATPAADCADKIAHSASGARSARANRMFVSTAHWRARRRPTQAVRQRGRFVAPRAWVSGGRLGGTRRVKVQMIAARSKRSCVMTRRRPEAGAHAGKPGVDSGRSVGLCYVEAPMSDTGLSVHMTARHAGGTMMHRLPMRRLLGAGTPIRTSDACRYGATKPA